MAIEGGGTRTRIWLADDAGQVVARHEAGPASPLYIDPGAYAAELRGIFGRIRDEASGPVTQAGLSGPMERALVEVLIREVFGAITVAGFGESEIALACADMTWGISLIAGTGASCRACDANGHWNGCGGFGPQFGDEGSGYWIGREAVAALLRVEDGRGGATTLHQAVCGAFGIENVRDIYRFVDRSGHVSGTRIASLVPLVFEAARGGDRVAIAICRLAGEELGRLACATARQVEWSSTPVPLVASGGVFHAGALVIEPMVAALKECPVAMEAPRVVTEPTEGIIKLLLAGSDRLD